MMKRKLDKALRIEYLESAVRQTATFTESMRPQDSCRHTPAVIVGLPAIKRAKIRVDAMRTIPLTQGKVALVDDADYDRLSQHKWYANKDRHTFYAARGGGGRRNQKTELMHRLILGLQPGDKRECHHRDGNGLNNQRSNLRTCTKTENGQSRRKWKSATSRYKGVSWRRDYYKWRSRIKVNRKQIHLGYYCTAEAAARAYDRAAVIYHGEFALTNERMGLI